MRTSPSPAQPSPSRLRVPSGARLPQLSAKRLPPVCKSPFHAWEDSAPSPFRRPKRRRGSCAGGCVAVRDRGSLQDWGTGVSASTRVSPLSQGYASFLWFLANCSAISPFPCCRPTCTPPPPPPPTARQPASQLIKTQQASHSPGAFF